MARVLISIPYWGCQSTIRRAVDSVLAQSFRDLLVVVLNDGDRDSPPWPPLADITDPRLIRHDMRRNRGRYFADAVAATAADGLCPWWSPIDADDWVEPHRYATLDYTGGPADDVVMTPWTNHHPTRGTGTRAIRPPESARGIRCTAHMSSLWRPGFARNLAHPGQRVAWDQVMTTAAWVFGQVATVDDPSYHRVVRAGSLMLSSIHGKGTPVRRAAKLRQRTLWRQMRRQPDLSAAAKVLAADVPRELVAAVQRESGLLRRTLEGR